LNGCAGVCLYIRWCCHRSRASRSRCFRPATRKARRSFHPRRAVQMTPSLAPRARATPERQATSITHPQARPFSCCARAGYAPPCSSAEPTWIAADIEGPPAAGTNRNTRNWLGWK
jgi:hypothetical protein